MLFTLDSPVSRGNWSCLSADHRSMIGNIRVAFDMNQRSVGADGAGVALEVNPMQLRNSARGYGRFRCLCTGSRLASSCWRGCLALPATTCRVTRRVRPGSQPYLGGPRDYRPGRAEDRLAAV